MDIPFLVFVCTVSAKLAFYVTVLWLEKKNIIKKISHTKVLMGFPNFKKEVGVAVFLDQEIHFEDKAKNSYTFLEP